MAAQPNTMQTIRFDSPEFKKILSHFETQPQETETDSNNLLVLFAGCQDDEKQKAIGEIMGASGFNMHQIDLTGLVSERRLVTQGNLREVFDSNQEDASILFLDADAFFTAVNQAEHEAGEDTLTPINYLFQRMENHKGIIILRLMQAEHLDKARDAVDFDIVVEF